LLEPSQRILCYVADYAQNMQVPNFASEQPGATYYFSAMNAYVFGVVDANVDALTAYIYNEDLAKKGGNNVTSLLMHHLHRKGILQEAATKGPFKELNFVMDNCSGQNKNRMVLRLLHILVKTGVATTASAIFLVRGHTKNDCDRLFNTMKRQYRKTNCFTPKDLIEGMRHDKVDPVAVGEGIFKDWDTLEDTYIKAPLGATNTNHIFTVDINVDNGNSMCLRESDGNMEKKTLVLVKRQYLNKDIAFWKAMQPEDIPPVGVQDIKWRTLYKQWGPYIPQDKRKEWRYYHEAPPAAKLKEVAEHTKEARKQRKARSRTIVDADGNTKMPATKTTKDKPPKKRKPTSTTDDNGNNNKKKANKKKKTKTTTTDVGNNNKETDNEESNLANQTKPNDGQHESGTI
jgi:hypothetical protein